MLDSIINSIKGTYTLKAEGKFPERILNIASTSGIYIRNVKRESPQSLIFSVSKKGFHILSESSVEGIELTVVEKYGIPVFFRRYRKRALLLFLPLIIISATSIFSQFIWKVEIIGGDASLRKQVRDVIEKNGIYFGAPKFRIDNYKIKKNSILAVDGLSWLWVDVRGTTAKVKIQERKKVPEINEIHEPANVISMHSGVIEKMQVYCGIPLFKEGMTVEKGQILISGILKSEKENIPTYLRHASGNVVLRVFEKKTVIIPKKTLIKVHTGKKKNVFSLNFKKNNINFSLNSGISYKEYDKIEKKYKLPLFPLWFSKVTYKEVHVVSRDTNIEFETDKRRNTFLGELKNKDMELCNFSEEQSETEGELTITFTAECLVRTDKEIPVKQEEIGEESYGKNN